MNRKLLMIVEVEAEGWRIKHYQKLGHDDQTMAEYIADDFLSADGEYMAPNLIKAEWVEE